MTKNYEAGRIVTIGYAPDTIEHQVDVLMEDLFSKETQAW